MFTRADILSRPHYWVGELRFELARAIGAYQDAQQLTRTQLARHLQCSEAEVARLLNADANPTLETLCRLLLLVGQVPRLALQPTAEMLTQEI